MNPLKRFVANGMKAQEEVDKILEKEREKTMGQTSWKAEKKVFLPKTKKLHRLDSEIRMKLLEYAIAWGKLNGVPESEMYTLSIPHALFDILISLDHRIGDAIVQAWQTKGTNQ